MTTPDETTQQPTAQPISRRRVVAGGVALAWTAPAITRTAVALGAEGSERGVSFRFVVTRRSADDLIILRLENTSDTGGPTIVGATLTIGDTGFNFGPFNGGSIRSEAGVNRTNTPASNADVLTVSYTGFDPGEFVAYDIDINQDGGGGSPDFRDVMLIGASNGDPSHPNSVLTVEFSDGTVLTATLTGNATDTSFAFTASA